MESGTLLDFRKCISAQWEQKLERTYPGNRAAPPSPSQRAEGYFWVLHCESLVGFPEVTLMKDWIILTLFQEFILLTLFHIDPQASHQNYYVFLQVMALVASAADKQILVSTLYPSFSPDFRVLVCFVTLAL